MNETNVESSAEQFSFLDFVGQAQTIWSIIVFCIFVLFFSVSLIAFRRNINRISMSKIKDFKKAKKYIPEIYVELNDNMENLRCFFFATRWKLKLVKKYNLLFRGYVGKQLKSAYKHKIKFYISPFHSMKKVNSIISQTRRVLESFRDEREINREQMGDFYFVISGLSYDCLNRVNELLNMCSMVECKNMIIVGSAGNGKTSLMCRATEMAMANKYPCLLINSRDVEVNTVDFIVNKLPLLGKVKSHPTWFLRVINRLLWLKRKHLFIVIDAINENDREVFLKTIGDVCDYFDKYSQVKILMSCRSEYFNSRYQKTFENAEDKPTVFNLSTSNYDSRAIKRFFRVYREHYNVPNFFSQNVKNKLSKSLFLMRIFFEVNSNREPNHLEFQDAEIYKQYVERVAADNPKVDLQKVLNQIVDAMIAQNSYDRVEFSEINLPLLEKEAFLKLLDNNLLINKTIISGVGISEHSTEYLFFIFDEFRDYCIARRLLILAEKDNDSEYSTFFKLIEKMYINTLSPIEGMLKYAYYHFKIQRASELCNKILSLHGTSKIQQINFRRSNDRNKTYFFDDFGVALIFMSGKDFETFEDEYIKKSIKESIDSHMQILFFLLNNDICNDNPGISYYLNILFAEKDFEFIENIILKLLERDSYNYEAPRYIDHIYDRLDYLVEKNGDISGSLKELLIIIFSYDRGEWYYIDNEPIFFEETVYDDLIGKVQSSELKEKISKLKEREFAPQESTAEDILLAIKKMLGEGWGE